MAHLEGTDAAAIGVDLGGTKVAAVLLSADGACVADAEIPTAAARGVDAVASDIFGLVADLGRLAAARGLEVQGVGLVSAGIVDPERGVLVAVTDTLAGLAGWHAGEQLASGTGLAVKVLNDVQGMALAEQRLGAGVGAACALYVAAGTGIGGALTRDGALVLGAHGFAGDLGHIVVDLEPGAPRCACGRVGHLEAYASGPAIAAAYAAATGGRPGQDLRIVAERAAAGETPARGVLASAARVFGRGVGGLVNVVDPDKVVFGGGMAALDPALFWDGVFAALNAEVRGPVRPELSLAALGTRAAAVGAALVGFEAGGHPVAGAKRQREGNDPGARPAEPAPPEHRERATR